VVTLLAASGKDVVLVETVGVGQDEVEIVGTADVSVVVLVPGLGDEVQALKAGIMEIADVFVVNKADREGVDRVVAEIESMLSLSDHDGHRPEIVQTVATKDEGTAALLLAVRSFREKASASGVAERRRRAQAGRLFEEALQERLLQVVERRALTAEQRERTLERLAAREIDPFTAAGEVLRRLEL
jgi:LAO/AO transport system kinase